MAESQESIDISQDRGTSQTTIDLHANADNISSRLETPGSSSKQKRRRTSPRDHAILEAAYQKNSKPDKEERLNLVKLVDLGEKEVQIWFQNRRQNDRRKSKPLQPHELIPHFRNGIPVEANSQLPSPQNSQDPISKEPSTTRENAITSTPTPAIQTSPRQINLKALLNDSDLPSSSPTARRPRIEDESPVLSTPPSSFESPTPNTVLSNTSPATAGHSEQTHLAKKRSHEEMTGNVQDTQAREDPSRDPKSLRRTSSFVRLAVSADGSVKVRVNDETTPSPPKSRPQPPPNMSNRRSSGFSRAQSDLSSSLNFKDTGPGLAGVLGRSRDARTWEFYCDRNARSSLAARAEEEATGSAVGALGLMRSASQRRVQALSPNPAKQNKVRRGISRFKTKPTMSRSQSSMARLQSSDTMYDEADPKPKKASHLRHSSGGDSDKENWLPGTRDSVHDLRRVQPTNGGPILRESGLPAEPGIQSSAPNPVQRQEKKSAPGSGKDKGDDLDCVQGLLSLSQGAWR